MHCFILYWGMDAIFLFHAAVICDMVQVLAFTSSFILCRSSVHVRTHCLSGGLPGGRVCVCTAVRSWLPLECFPESLEFLGDSTCVFFFCFFLKVALLMNSAACCCVMGAWSYEHRALWWLRCSQTE